MAGILISSFNHPSCFVISNEQTTNTSIESSHLPMRMMPATKYPSLKLQNKPLATPHDREPSSYSNGPTKKKKYKRNDQDEIRRLNKLERERSKSTNFPIGRTTLYDLNQSSVILGDGNLCFSRSLIERLGTGNITTTVYDPLYVFMVMYKDGSINANECVNKGAKLLFGTSAETIGDNPTVNQILYMK